MEKVITLHNNEEANILFGRHDEHLKILEKELAIKIIARGEKLTINGKEKNLRLAVKLIDELVDVIRLGGHIKKQDIIYAIRALHQDSSLGIHSIYLDRIEVMSKKQYITPKTKGQKEYS